MSKYPKIFLVIVLCSFASLAYEITLTRIFSITLWYHFAFMIVSIAMLGIGASGTLMSLYPKLKDISHIGLYSLLLGISIALSYLGANQIPFDPVKLSWAKMQLFYIGMYYMILSVPFFFTGLIIAAALASLSEKAGLFYGADLLGAGIGSAGVISLMMVFMPDTIVFILSLFALTGAFITGGKRLKVVSFILIMCIIAVILLHPDFIKLKMSPYKGLKAALRYPGAEHLKTYVSPFSRIDTIKSPAVRYAPGLSLRYLDALPAQIGFSIDGGELHAITEDSNQASMTFLSYLPSALPYVISNPSLNRKGGEGLSNVLIIDPKGCLQCQIARHYGFSHVYKIESNPLVIKIIKRDFNEFSDGVYDMNTWSGNGRAWMRRKGMVFDIIDIPLTGTTPSGTFGITEDYKLTVEAFQNYFKHLKPNGMININLFILPPPRTELRILTTAIAALKEAGIADHDIKKHFAALRSWGSICIIIKKSPFISHETDAIKRFARNRRFDLIYYPGIRKDETNIHIRMPTNEYYTTFQKILNTAMRKEFIDDYVFDVSPVHDKNPFFHYYLKIKNIKKIYELTGGKWQYFIEEGYILPVALIQVVGFSLFLILLPAYKTRTGRMAFKERTYNDCWGGSIFLPYFAFLGAGFMFVEVSLIQRMILPLENPSYAFATILTSLLISSGMGSLLSHRVKVLRNSFVTFILAVLIIIYSLFIPSISDIVSLYPILFKIFLVFCIFMPLGLFMGIPFPAGLRILGQKQESVIPWAWAVNGCFSVLTPLLTVMLAIIIGFKIVLWLGALAYFMAFITLQIFLKKSHDYKKKVNR